MNKAVRLPLLNKLFFTADHIGLQAIDYFRQFWVLFFLAPPAAEGIARVPDTSLLGFDIDPRVLAGILIFAGRIVDAFTDPIVGWWSDRTRSRWGRRIPFVLFSTPFYALFAALVWLLPAEGASWWNALFFVIVLELFFTARTLSSGALEALIPEVTDSAKDRTNIATMMFLFAVVGAGVALIIGGPVVDALGVQAMGIILAVVGVVFRYMALAAVWNHAPRHTPPAQVSFFQGMRSTLSNPQFVYYLPTYIMFVTGAGVLVGWLPYFVSQILMAEDEGAASAMLSAVVIGGTVVSGIFFWSLMNRGIVNKRQIYGLCLVGSGVAFPLLGLTGLFSDSGTMLQAIVLLFIAGVPMAAVFMLPKALTADIADYDAMLTGERREAMFYSTQNFFEKVSFALPPLLLSLVLLAGDSADNPLGIRLAPLLAGGLALLGIALWPRYRLPETVNRETVAAAGLLPRSAGAGRPAP